ncbi:spermatogenesis-defective protein 39 homolog [Lytechinus pictus]|uniref:spermatogenesis-defective protein 39 homolog n=1 Tax=Lytechinus pictus TaxID=7653 RepID=UPI0030BA214F
MAQSSWGKEMSDDMDDEYWNEKPGKRRNFFDDKPTSPPPDSTDSGKKETRCFAQSLKDAGLDIDNEPRDFISMHGGVPRFSKDAGRTHSGSFSSGSATGRPHSLQSARGTSLTPQSSAGSNSVPVELKTSRSSSVVVEGSGKSSSATSSTTSSPAASGPGTDGLYVHRRSASASLGDKKNTSQSSSPGSSHGSHHGSSASIDETTKKDTRPSMTEVAKLQAEIHALHRKIKSLEKSRWSALPVADTVSRIITGERYSLEPYKSLKDKMTLLDAAIGFHDGNAIIAIVMFLKKTLSKTIFHQELSKRPEAVNQYISFLKSYQSKEESVAAELGALGRVEEAALWRYKLASQTELPQQRLTRIMDCNSMYFQRKESLATENEIIKEQVLLLNKQLQIEPRDQRYQIEGRFPFRELPRKTSLYFQPVITTLFYCCLYHYASQESDMSNPQTLKREFNLSDKQFLFQALLARAKLKDWTQVEALLTSKNWLGKAKMKAAVTFSQVVYILVTVKAPTEIIAKYMMFIEDKESRIAMATKFKIHVVVIDTLAQLKDRQRLLAYRPQCINTPADTHFEIVLRNTDHKWKN